MKSWLPAFLVLLLMSLSGFAASPRDPQWAEVRAALDQGLPQTALERLKPILASAVAAQSWGEVARVIAQRVTLEAQIQGGLPEERVLRYQAALSEAPEPVRPLVQALLAHSYWAYFEQNKWRVRNRTASEEPPSDDFRTWDVRRLFAAIDASFSAALAQPEALRSLPIAQFDGFLQPGTVPDRFRPTLYDFLAHEALAFYVSGEQAAARPEDAWTVPVDSPAFAPRSAFLAWTPAAPESPSVEFKSIRLYQDLLRSHLGDTDRSALLDADLARLRFAGNVATGGDREVRVLQALGVFAETEANHEISALARHTAADIHRHRGELAEAHRLASAGARAFPDSPGGKLCQNLVRLLETPRLRVQTEQVWCAPWPELTLHHANQRQAFFRVVRTDWDQFLDRRRRRPEQMTPQDRVALLRETPVHAWSVDLPATPDFKEHRTRSAVPSHLAAGYYFLLASRRADFGEDENEVSYTPFWVSDLALVVQTRRGLFEGWVLDALQGTPVEGARVEAWYLGDNGTRMPLPPVRSDADGAFTFSGRAAAPRTPGHLFKATLGNRVIATSSDVAAFEFESPQGPQEQTLFFTDRALYRPGQSIQYKGICILSRPGDQTYLTLSNRTVTVLLRDANGQELSRASHRANDYGSFSGSFTTPPGTLTGSFTLAIENGPPGAHSVQVEEYKRPRFETLLDAPREGGRLGAEVTVPGRATTYAGTPVDAAQVRWTVRRQMRFPPWWGWRVSGRTRHQAPQEIAHGDVTTKADGSFEVSFTALPDPQAQAQPDTSFSFEIQAEVTDASGETRVASRTVRFGPAALEIQCPAPEWPVAGQPVTLRITTRTLDDVGVRARGTIKIHRLRQPERVQRAPLEEQVPMSPEGEEDAQNQNNPDRWELAELVSEQPFTSGTNGVAEPTVTLPGGAYRALLAADDGHGKTVTHQVPLLVRDLNASAAAIRLPMDVSAPTWTVEPGHDLLVLWGTGYPTGRALVQIEHGQKILQRFWTPEGRTQVPLRFPVTESLRGGFTLHVTFVRENRCYRVSHEVSVPWTNQKLELAWSTFRAKLEPGQKETWSVAVKPPPGSPPLSAEMVATLFDASLDQFFPLNWPDGFHVFGNHYSSISLNFANEQRWLDRVHGRVRTPRHEVRLTYRSFPPEFLPRRSSMMVRTMATAMAPMAAAPMPEAVADALEFRVAKGASPGALEGAGGGALAEIAGAAARTGAASDRSPAGGSQASASPGASVRRNLQETAFFLPHLLTDRDGGIRLEFTLPEALTRWRFLGFAHDARLRAGLLEGAAVASRDLMILPNPPRFLREGDEVEFSARIINQSEVPQRGTARLEFKYATGSQAGTEANAALGLNEGQLAFEIPAGATRGVSWRLRVPDGAGFLTYEVSARGLRHTDGESGILPVLSRRVLVTESLPLPIRGPGRKTFTFEALRNAAQSSSLTHERFTVQMASNPAWYAVLALPTLMEYPHECAEQVFNRLYANALAHALATRDPRLRQTFELWRNTPALDSPLEKNGDLKSVALAETPWVRDAKSESEARRNLGLLFDPVRNKAQTDRALRQLAEMCRPEGGWSWFPGGPLDEFITLYIVAGFGRLQQLGVELPDDLPARALPVLDQSMHDRWDRLRTDKLLEGNHLTPSIAFSLYARSFFARRHPLAPQHVDAFAYWLAQAETHWVKLEHRLPQGHLALAFHRLRTDTPHAARTQLPEQILRSLAERSVTHEEFGRFWREDEYSASWFRAPIETQALMIEAFSLLAPDRQVVDELKIWLLKQKQTQDWKTTKATADAVYALLLQGSDLLADARLVKVSVGGRSITPGTTDAPGATGPAPTPEPGTGFFETRYARTEITPALARIEVDKPTPGIAWGAAHWQYFEEITRLRAHAATPLRLEKSVLRRVSTATGPELRPLGDRVQVGDELVVRLTLRTDRDLEYVHLKDQRGSGTEPVNVLSRYRFQDGFGYYESTKDTASHFFLGYLPKGTYVFEYAVRAQLRGRYTAGMAEVQCLYAPEFNSHSTSTPLTVE